MNMNEYEYMLDIRDFKILTTDYDTSLALVFVFDVNIYSSRLFKIDPVISLLPANHGQ